MKITLNGQIQKIKNEVTLLELMNSLNQNTIGVAIAVNAQVIPKSQWNELKLGENDKLEILSIAQGG